MTDKTQTKAVSNALLTDEEFAEKYNRGHKIIDFVGQQKDFLRNFSCNYYYRYRM